MKKITYVLLLISLVSCQGEGVSIDSVIAGKDVDAIRAKRNEVSGQKKALEVQLAQLDSAIASLDDNANVPLVTSLAIQPERFDHFLDLQGG